MSKKVLAISTSLRKEGNSEILADAFLKGAEEAGHSVEKICIYDKVIGFCRGCLSCQKTQKCVIKDDANEIVEKMRTADVIAFATPIYYYEMSGQMKTLLDRANPLFPGEYAFRDIYLLTAAADSSKTAMDGAIKGLEGWISCFEQARLAGVVYGTGVDSPGEIREISAALEEARQMGENLSLFPFDTQQRTGCSGMIAAEKEF